MITTDQVLVWIGATPAIISGLAMLMLGQIAGGLLSLVVGAAMLAAVVTGRNK